MEWEYLFPCLKHFGFSNPFINWVKILYQDSESCVLSNGFMSSFFKITRSVRQGDPLAAYLYVLQAEPLACSIRKKSKIKGIELPIVDNKKIEVRLSMFADDAELFHSTVESIKEGFSVLQMYSRASGAKINVQKTKALKLGRWKSKKVDIDGISWSTHTQGLGATMVNMIPILYGKIKF